MKHELKIESLRKIVNSYDKIDKNIPKHVAIFFSEIDNHNRNKEFINLRVQSVSGIESFFENEDEVSGFYNEIERVGITTENQDRAEFGDFQTNSKLAKNVCNLLIMKGIQPEFIIEPTCGKGNFLLAAIESFPDCRMYYGIEIYEPYYWHTIFEILNHFLNNPSKSVPNFFIFKSNIFDFNFNKHVKKDINNILILGNPPWVTNSMLSSLDSINTPNKSNFKNQKGIDAITGKGNFDIAEYITLSLLDGFSHLNGYYAFLLKNTVIKNLVFEQKKAKRSIGEIEKYSINAKEEFKAAVDASLLICKLNIATEYICQEYDFYTLSKNSQFGWVGDDFVSDIELYKTTNFIEGKSPFVWRQGVKHDASNVMELERVNGHYVNNLKEEFELEDELVYGILKSSDLKGATIDKSRKYTIITQRKTGQETNYIKTQHPKTYSYLTRNQEFFSRRKSIIYKDKAQFSIFGIGDYAFLPYKVAISGMYKDTTFSLVLTNKNKAIMLDDTCYFIGFNNIEFAVITQFLLNQKVTQDFIKSISFSDSKRKVTKELLMRIDLSKIAQNISYEQVSALSENITKEIWTNYLKLIESTETSENLFDFG